jgi:hypothetical protein
MIGSFILILRSCSDLVEVERMEDTVFTFQHAVTLDANIMMNDMATMIIS